MIKINKSRVGNLNAKKEKADFSESAFINPSNILLIDVPSLMCATKKLQNMSAYSNNYLKSI